MSLRVVYFHRKRGPEHFSLERVFSDIREQLASSIHGVVAHCPRPSKGIWNRIVNVLWAYRNQGDVNHITGDVHYLTFLLRKNATILTIADCVPLERSRGLKRWLLWLFWYWLPEKRSGKITAISTFTKNQLLLHVSCDPDKIAVVHCPVAKEFAPSPKPFDVACPVVLQVGTGWNKNLEGVAKALKGIACRLEIVGQVSEAQRSVLAVNGIAFACHIGVSDEEMRSLYRKCDLVVFASVYEGFGLPIIEAQAIGRPVVTSNCCSMPEVAGDSACLVNPDSIDSIRLGIMRVLGDQAYREGLIAKGFENVKRFPPARIAEQYAELYRRMIS